MSIGEPSHGLMLVCVWTPKIPLANFVTWADMGLVEKLGELWNIIILDLLRSCLAYSCSITFSCVFGYGSERVKWWMEEVSGVSTDLIPTWLTECHHVEVLDRASAKQVESNSWELLYPYWVCFIVNYELLELSSYISCTSVIVTWTMCLHAFLGLTER